MMKWFNDLSMRAKLRASFLVVFMLTLFVGAYTIVELGNMHAGSKEIFEDHIPSMVNLFDVRRHVNVYRQLELQHGITEADEDMSKLERVLADEKAQLSQSLSGYEKVLTDDDDRRLLADDREAIERFLADAESTLPLSRKNMKAEFRDRVLGNQQALFDEVTRRIATHIAYIDRDTANEAANANATHASVRTSIVVALVVSIVIGLGLSWALGRGFGNVLGHVLAVSADVGTAAKELSSVAEQISSGAQQQASSLQEAASSLEEISATVKQNADNAQQASQLANGARDTAEKGGKVVDLAVSAMVEITRSSKKIADIITSIDEIAFQTNLLALNAAVEAARAGEQGRGFGVVATEVRSLAQRAATAAKEIRALISDSSVKVEAGTAQVNHSGETLGEIVSGVKRMVDMVADIAAASREQNTGLEQANGAVAQMDQVTQSNASQTEELSATAVSLSEKAAHLESLINSMQNGARAERLEAKLHVPSKRAHASARQPMVRAPSAAPDSGVLRTHADPGASASKAAGEAEEF